MINVTTVSGTGATVYTCPNGRYAEVHIIEASVTSATMNVTLGGASIIIDTATIIKQGMFTGVAGQINGNSSSANTAMLIAGETVGSINGTTPVFKIFVKEYLIP